MPEITLNHFREVDSKRQVAINSENPRQLNTDGERHVFLGRLVDKMSRTSEQREDYRTATKKFIELVKEEYGERVGGWATRELSEHIEKGKPLTGYRIEKILARAERGLQEDRNESDLFLEQGLGKLVDREVERLGVEIDEGMRDFLVDVSSRYLLLRPEYNDPTKLYDSLESIYETRLKTMIKGQIELFAPALELAKQTDATWAKDRKSLDPGFDNPEVTRDFFNHLHQEQLKFARELESQGVVRGSPEFYESIKGELDAMVGKAFRKIAESQHPGRREINRDEGTLLEKEISLSRKALQELPGLAPETLGKLEQCLDRMEQLRDEVVKLSPEDHGDLGLVMDLSVKIERLRNDFEQLHRSIPDKETKMALTDSIRDALSHLPSGGKLEFQVDRLRETMLARLNLPELIKTEETVGRHLMELGQMREELQRKDSSLLENPVTLQETLLKLDLIEGNVQKILDNSMIQNSNLRLILETVQQSIRFSRDMIHEQQGEVPQLLQQLRESGFSKEKLKAFANAQGFEGQTLSKTDLENLVHTLKNGFTSQQVMELRKQGMSSEQIREQLK